MKNNSQSLLGEVWRPIFKYETRYEVSNLGRIKYLKTDNILKPQINDQGKYHIALSGDGIKQSLKNGKISVRQKIKRFEIGYLIAMAFKRHSHLNEKYVRYLDDNYANLKPENITWSDQRENSSI